mmetsp:Transcript_34975/g.85001  ORF Transcript_34975/g.85001 Transcript_34975/m.85001 type:complete len:283 (-) Transcript_34975:333-1181(-)
MPVSNSRREGRGFFDCSADSAVPSIEDGFVETLLACLCIATPNTTACLKRCEMEPKVHSLSCCTKRAADTVSICAPTKDIKQSIARPTSGSSVISASNASMADADVMVRAPSCFTTETFCINRTSTTIEVAFVIVWRSGSDFSAQRVLRTRESATRGLCDAPKTMMCLAEKAEMRMRSSTSYGFPKQQSTRTRGHLFRQSGKATASSSLISISSKSPRTISRPPRFGPFESISASSESKKRVFSVQPSTTVCPFATTLPCARFHPSMVRRTFSTMRPRTTRQ